MFYTLIKHRFFDQSERAQGPIYVIMYNKTVIGFGFCDIQNNQGLGKGYQPSVSADNPYLDLVYSGYYKNRIQ